MIINDVDQRKVTSRACRIDLIQDSFTNIITRINLVRKNVLINRH